MPSRIVSYNSLKQNLENVFFIQDAAIRRLRDLPMRLQLIRNQIIDSHPGGTSEAIKPFFDASKEFLNLIIEIETSVSSIRRLTPQKKSELKKHLLEVL